MRITRPRLMRAAGRLRSSRLSRLLLTHAAAAAPPTALWLIERAEGIQCPLPLQPLLPALLQGPGI